MWQRPGLGLQPGALSRAAPEQQQQAQAAPAHRNLLATQQQVLMFFHTLPALQPILIDPTCCTAIHLPSCCIDRTSQTTAFPFFPGTLLHVLSDTPTQMLITRCFLRNANATPTLPTLASHQRTRVYISATIKLQASRLPRAQDARAPGLGTNWRWAAPQRAAQKAQRCGKDSWKGRVKARKRDSSHDGYTCVPGAGTHTLKG